MAQPAPTPSVIHLQWREGLPLLFCANESCHNIIRNTVVSIDNHFRGSRCSVPYDSLSRAKDWLCTQAAIVPEDSRTFLAWMNDLRFNDPVEPFPFLPTLPGNQAYGCELCAYAVKATNKMRQHYRTTHPESPIPATLRFATVQTIQSGQQVRYIQVTRPTGITSLSAGSLLARHLDDDPTDTAVNTTGASARSEPNKWLERLRFNVHLEGYDLAAMASLVTRDHSEQLDFVISHLSAMAWRARDLLAQTSLEGSQVLKQLNRRKYSEIPAQNFNWDIQTNTLTKYIGSWALVLGYADKIRNWHHDCAPLCRLTEEQESAMVTALRLDWGAAPETEKDAAVLDLVWTICSQKLRRSPFDNVLVSACAVLAIDPRDTSWRTALSYESTHLSAFIKVFLFVVYLRAITAIDDQINHRQQPTWTSEFVVLSASANAVSHSYDPQTTLSDLGCPKLTK
ncbi:hypothetical protein F4859DRAFT_219035 [Xylaria cf. heliscus]|nr:hypothetical protein F4859DRAFT_219035 [Xylaria cf. heliscus]